MKISTLTDICLILSKEVCVNDDVMADYDIIRFGQAPSHLEQWPEIWAKLSRLGCSFEDGHIVLYV